MIRAIAFESRQEFLRKALPGSFWIGPDENGCREFFFMCPSGSGIQQKMLVGEGFKPERDFATWSWNGSTTEPTLEPSVNHVGHWHGWLRDGYWSEVRG